MRKVAGAEDQQQQHERMTVLLYNFGGDGVRDAADPYAMTGKG